MIRRGEISATATVGDVLRWAAERRESGGLVLDGSDGADSGVVYLLDGDITLVTTGRSLPMERQLLAAGVVTREQLPDVSAQVRSGRDLAYVLAAEPGIEFRGVVQVMHDSSVEALARLLGVAAGTFSLDRYLQHPFGGLSQWGVEPMIELADRKYRYDLLDPAAAVLLDQVPVPATGGDDDRDLVLTPVELRLLLAARDDRTLEEVAGRAGLELSAAALLAQRLADRDLLRFTPGGGPEPTGTTLPSTASAPRAVAADRRPERLIASA